MLTSQRAEKYLSKCPGEHTNLQHIEVARVFLSGLADIFFSFSSTTALVFFVFAASPLCHLLPPFHLFLHAWCPIPLIHLLLYFTASSGPMGVLILSYRPREDFSLPFPSTKTTQVLPHDRKNTTRLFTASLYVDRTTIQPELTPPD